MDKIVSTEFPSWLLLVWGKAAWPWLFSKVSGADHGPRKPDRGTKKESLAMTKKQIQSKRQGKPALTYKTPVDVELTKFPSWFLLVWEKAAWP